MNYLIKFKIIIIKMPSEVKRTIHEQNETFNAGTENIRKSKTEISELKFRAIRSKFYRKLF
jgi:hypothetical protein